MFSGSPIRISNGSRKSLSQLPKRDAHLATTSMTNRGSSGGQNVGDSVIIGGVDVSTPYVDEISHKAKCAMYRDIYYHDPLAGAAVDLMCNLPFSDFTLTVSNTDSSEKIREKFDSDLNRMKIATALPSMMRENLVLGAHISILVYRAADKSFTDTIPLNYDDCEVITNILYGRDPVIDVKTSQEMKKFLSSNSDQARDIIKNLNSNIIDSLKSGSFTLDPMAAIYFPRRGFTNDDYGSSIYRRIIPIYLLEKVLFRGTLTMANRRQNSITHITAGDEDWEPNASDLEDLVSLVTQADRDPLGAVIATRKDVDINDIGRGRDFWRWNEISDELNSRKLLALGINESFMCLTGDTRISTDKGLLRIDEIGDLTNTKKDSYVEIDTQIKGIDGKPVRAYKLWNRGKSQVYDIETKSGQSLSATPSHRFLILNENLELEWRSLQNMKKGDLLVKESTGTTLKKKTLKLNLETLDLDTKDYKRPSKMTPHLAWLMGFILAKGNVEEYGFNSTSSDPKLLNHMQKCANKVFGLEEGVRCINQLEGSEYNVLGKTNIRKETTERLEFESKQVASYLTQLGLSSKTNENKTLPWSIFQSNEKNRLAFLSGFIDGDGKVVVDKKKVKGIQLFTSSPQLAKDLRSLVSDLGYNLNSLLRLEPNASRCLYRKLEKYLKCSRNKGLTTKDESFERNEKTEMTKWSRVDGIPGYLLRNLIDKHLLTKTVDEGSWYQSEQDDTAHLIRDMELRFDRYSKGILGYDAYEKGQYEEYLNEIARFLPATIAMVRHLFKIQYYFDPIVYRKLSEDKRSLYDLSVKGIPAFTANGITTHNSGDMSLNSMETALSVFMDNLNAMRDSATRNIMTNKLFPLISSVNNFRRSNFRNKETAARGHTKIHRSVEVDVHDSSDLIIPTVNYTKYLSPKGDEQAMELMEKLSDKGVPFTLRAWAAAGGYDLSEIIDSHSSNLEDEKRMKDLGIGGALDTNDVFASSLGPAKGISLASRKFSDNDRALFDDKGKRIAINESRVNSKMNEVAFQAQKRLAESNGKPKSYYMKKDNNR